MKIKFTTFEDIKIFSQNIKDYQSDIFVKSGRYTVDAKSIMGLFSLNISNLLDIEIIEKKANETEEIRNMLKIIGILVEV